MVSTALQFEAVVVACAPSRGTPPVGDLRQCARASQPDRDTHVGRINKHTDRTLLDIVFVILAEGQPLTLSRVGELE
jgi:hypothetical protein